MAEVVQHRQGAAPGVAGRGGVAGSLVGVAEVVEHHRLVVALSELTPQLIACACSPSWWCA